MRINIEINLNGDTPQSVMDFSERVRKGLESLRKDFPNVTAIMNIDLKKEPTLGDRSPKPKGMHDQSRKVSGS